jgi:hypothetical protein
MYYIINKVLFNKNNELDENKITIECLEMYNKLVDAIEFVNNLKHISIFCEDVIINNEIHTDPITNKDIDGYHLVVDDENSRKYNIYEKKSNINKGYIYNTVDININFVGFIEIGEHKLNIKKICLKKRIKVLEDNNSSSDSDEIEIQPKKKRLDKKVSNNHIYVELNDKMLQELKFKLANLSIKKNK